jgi:hypothetical protein
MRIRRVPMIVPLVHGWLGSSVDEGADEEMERIEREKMQEEGMKMLDHWLQGVTA